MTFWPRSSDHYTTQSLLICFGRQKCANIYLHWHARAHQIIALCIRFWWKNKHFLRTFTCTYVATHRQSYLLSTSYIFVMFRSPSSKGMNMKKDRKKNRKLFKSHEKYFCLRYVAYVPRDDSLHVFAYVFLLCLCVTWKWMAFCIFIIIIILARGNHIVKPIRFA